MEWTVPPGRSRNTSLTAARSETRASPGRARMPERQVDDDDEQERHGDAPVMPIFDLNTRGSVGEPGAPRLSFVRAARRVFARCLPRGPRRSRALRTRTEERRTIADGFAVKSSAAPRATSHDSVPMPYPRHKAAARARSRSRCLPPCWIGRSAVESLRRPRHGAATGDREVEHSRRGARRDLTRDRPDRQDERDGGGAERDEDDACDYAHRRADDEER